MSGKSFVHSTAPDAFVQFWSFNSERVTSSTSQSASLAVSEVLVRKDIISIKTSKSKSSAGNFTIVLSSAANWKKAITVGSWCFIHISDRHLGGGEDTEPYGGLKMIGIVKSVRRQESVIPETGTRVVRYIVSGEDFQSAMNAKVYISPILTEGDNSKPVTSLAILGKFFEKSFAKGPAQIVDSLINAILGNADFEFSTKGPDGKQKTSKSPVSSFKAGAEFLVPKEVFSKIYGQSGTKLAAMISRQIYTPLIGKLSNFIPSFSDQTELWSAIQTYCNPILNEVYTELLPANVNGKTRLIPMFVMRPVPFSIKPPAGAEGSTIKFLSCLSKTKEIDPKKLGRDKAEKEREKSTQIPSKLSNHYYVSRQIFEDEIISLDDGKSDNERMNFFLVTSTIAGNADAITQTTGAGGLPNMVNTASAQRHGLRPLIYTTNYDTLQQGDTSFKTMTEIVKDMYENGYMYENGFLTIVGAPNHIPVGTNILFSERKWLAHVEAVSHDFSVEPNTGHKKYLTSIAFTRLMKTNGQPIDEFSTKLADGQLGEWDRGVTDYGDVGSIISAKELRNLPKVEKKKKKGK